MSCVLVQQWERETLTRPLDSGDGGMGVRGLRL